MTDFDLLCCVTAWVLDVCDTPIGDLGITTDVAVAAIRRGTKRSERSS